MRAAAMVESDRRKTEEEVVTFFYFFFFFFFFLFFFRFYHSFLPFYDDSGQKLSRDDGRRFEENSASNEVFCHSLRLSGILFCVFL